MTDPQIAIPEGETPEERCPYCDRPFRSERLYALHLGEEHWEACTDEQRDAYEDAYDEESYDLFTFHIKNIILLMLLYFSVTYAYGLVWTG